MKPILEISNVSKKFMINHEQQPYLSLRDTLSDLFKKRVSKKEFWALRNISFNVNEGDTIGIVGKNGAGKSTLLKILSKITPPTDGKIIGRGRIASLLEVGTGFHSELTGRENIFMNGSILGMKKTEILKNFDSIVDFSGVETFIDTPLKHYSSGMQLRLAFAVAAFLENEILIIDEVLAVGDADFQKKCIGKMENVSNSGRTILFVSHNTASLNRLCQKGIYLKDGIVHSTGKMSAVINEYLKDKVSSQLECNWIKDAAPLYLQSAYLIDGKGNRTNTICFKDEISIVLRIKRNGSVLYNEIEFGLAINTQFDIRMTISSFKLSKAVNNEVELKIDIPSYLFCPGYYDFDFSIQDSKKNLLDIQRSFCNFEIIKDNTEFEYLNYDYGLIHTEVNWQIL